MKAWEYDLKLISLYFDLSPSCSITNFEWFSETQERKIDRIARDAEAAQRRAKGGH